MTLVQILDYYVGLLTVAYRDKEKARATVAIAVKQAIADDLATAVQNAFDVDAAIGAQLDVIGAYVGVPRNIGTAVASPFFGLWDYASTLNPALYKGTWTPATDTPALPGAAGGNNGWWYVASSSGTSAAPIVATFQQGDVIFSNGAVWAKTAVPNGNGLTSYTDASINAGAVFYDYSFAGNLVSNLNDAQYRAVIKLKIVLNSNDGTLASIQALLYQFFPGLITLVDNTDMTLNYTVSNLIGLPLSVFERFLPKPMGVGITVSGDVITGDELSTEDGDSLTTEGGDILVITV